ncbi:MAG TPA: DUF2961 domain-containing protein, partial [Fimbriimonadaceae bacterium]|nr:DUF2961 domain-containing protein [Fimbriimonadaceae bacterium]
MVGLLLWLVRTCELPQLDVPHPLPGVSAFTSLLDLPYLRRGVQTHQFTSYDRAGDNYDADYFPLYKEADGACVLFDVYGPGCLYRLHANLWNGDLTGINIRFYFDDDTTPRIDMDVTRFFSPENPLGIFKEPYAHVGQGWRFVYHPFFFKRHLKVSLSKEPFGSTPLWDKLPWLGRYDQHPARRNHWYNFTFHTFAEATGIQSWTKPADMRPAAAFLDPGHNGEPPAPAPGAATHEREFELAPGASRETFQQRGSGVITALRLELDPADLAAAFDCNLRISFDGAGKPQVEAPLGCFFGIYRQRPDKWIVSRYVGVQGAKLYCYFPMPYWRGARVSIENMGRLAHRLRCAVETSGIRYPEAECGTFHAVYHRESPRTEGHDYRYVELRGEGHVVGHFTYRFDTSMEEDERTYFDDSDTPAIYGEGFEDDHNQGWGLRDATQAIYGSTGSDGGAGAVWRFFVPDLYVFHRSLRHGHQV